MKCAVDVLGAAKPLFGWLGKLVLLYVLYLYLPLVICFHSLGHVRTSVLPDDLCPSREGNVGIIPSPTVLRFPALLGSVICVAAGLSDYYHGDGVSSSIVLSDVQIIVDQ